MSFEFIFDQVRAAGAGLLLGILTAAWVHAVWSWWHPQTIRFWGTWGTDPRLLAAGGIVLAMAWMGNIFTSS